MPGAKIQLFSADSEATARKATEVIEKLYYTNKVDAVVGGYSRRAETIGIKANQKKRFLD